LGWYNNGLRHGNWMALRGEDLAVLEIGWYEEDVWIDGMKDDDKLMKFSRHQIFWDPA